MISIRKIFLKVPEITRKHLLWGLFCNKAPGLRPATSLNTESGTGSFLWILQNLHKNKYFAKACEGRPLKSKIFTGVSFRKTLGFDHKRKRQLFYYDELCQIFTWKFLSVNRIISQNSLSCCFWKYHRRQKTVLYRQKRNVSGTTLFGCLYGWLGIYFWSL